MKLKSLYKEAQFHGAKQLADKKFWFYWTCTIIFLFCSSVAVICVTVSRYFKGPTYNVNLDAIRTEITFPTIQICPEVNYFKDKMDKFVESIKYPSSLNATYIRRVINQLAAFSSADVDFDIDDLENIQYLLDFNNLEIGEVTKSLTASCEEILIKCRWIGRIVDCSTIFYMEITRTGYCCIFNGRSLTREMSGHIQNNERYTDNLSYDFENCLMFAVEERDKSGNIDLDYKWLNLQTGHHYVDISENGTAVTPGVEWHIIYTTKTVRVASDATNLNYDLRGCRLSSEPLKYFPIYHKTHCLLECEIERTIKRCQCLKLAHPKVLGMPLCRASRLNCSRKATVSYAIEECNCLPTCNVDLHYGVPEAFDLITTSHTIDRFYDGLDLKRTTVIRVIVKKHKQKIFERRSYFIWLTLFSQLGGIFNVFLGCSVLTLLEIMQLGWTALEAYYYRKRK